MLRFIVISLAVIMLVLGGLTKGGIIATKDAVGFLMNTNSFSNFVNQIPANKMNDYLNYLQISSLSVGVYNLPPNSVLKEATATLNNQQISNAWEIIVDNNNNRILQFSRIISSIEFSQLLVNTNNYVAAIVSDPNLSGQTAWGIGYNRNIYKIYKDGSTIRVEQKYSGNESGGIAAAIGDFNNDGKVDFFTVKTNENPPGQNNPPSKVSEAAVFVQGNNESFSKTVIDTNSWNQGQTKVDVKWTAGAITAQYQKWDNQNKQYITDKFDYNNDGKQDVLIASADGGVYAIPNTTTGNNITFGNPIKLVNTGLSTGQDGSYNGAQVLSLGDINKDGKPDLLVGSTDSAKLYIYYGKIDNQGRLYFGNGNSNQVSNPDIQLYDSQVNGNQKIVIRNSTNVESSEYRGPSTQTNGSGTGTPFPEFTGGITNAILADVNKDGELDILGATDNWQYSPTHYKIGNGPTNSFDLSIKHTDRNATLSKVGGRVYYMVRNPQTGKYKNFFLGQYAITQDNQNADFDNATITNFSGPTSIDFITTDGNHAQTLFSFLQSGNIFTNADSFTIESKDLVKKPGSTPDSFDFNSNSLYVKSITLIINGNLNGIPLIVSLANRVSNNIPIYVDVPIPSNTPTPLTVRVDFYPSNSKVIYSINGGPWQTTNIDRMRGNYIFYKLFFNTSDPSLKTQTTTLTGNNITGLNRTVQITEINVSYEVSPQSLKIKNWKEVR